DKWQSVLASGLSRHYPPADTSARGDPINRPRPASFWAGECASGTQLTPQQLDEVAARINVRSVLFDWAPGTERAQFCATVSASEPASVRARAKRELAGVMASFSAGERNVVP